GPACGQPAAAAGCPVCCLLAPVEVGHPRGQDVPRPYVLRMAPDAPLAYAPGQSFGFPLATFGGAPGGFPCPLPRAQATRGGGLGGSFRLAEVGAENRLLGRQERVYRAADGDVRTPNLAVDAAQVAAEAEALVGRMMGASSSVEGAGGVQGAASSAPTMRSAN